MDDAVHPRVSSLHNQQMHHPPPMTKDAAGWASDHEAVLAAVQNACMNSAEKHRVQYFHLQSFLKYFRVPSIILSAVASVASVGLQPYAPQKFVSLITCLLSLIVGIINSLELYLQIQASMENELMSYKDYYMLANEISKTLVLHPSHRTMDGSAYIEEKFSVFMKVMENAKPLHNRTRDPFRTSPVIRGSEGVLINGTQYVPQRTHHPIHPMLQTLVNNNKQAPPPAGGFYAVNSDGGIHRRRAQSSGGGGGSSSRGGGVVVIGRGEEGGEEEGGEGDEGGSNGGGSNGGGSNGGGNGGSEEEETSSLSVAGTPTTTTAPLPLPDLAARTSSIDSSMSGGGVLAAPQRTKAFPPMPADHMAAVRRSPPAATTRMRRSFFGGGEEGDNSVVGFSPADVLLYQHARNQVYAEMPPATRRAILARGRQPRCSDLSDDAAASVVSADTTNKKTTTVCSDDATDADDGGLKSVVPPPPPPPVSQAPPPPPPPPPTTTTED